MRKVVYGGGLFTYKDIENLYAPERFVTLITIAPPDEIEAKEKFLARIQNLVLSKLVLVNPFFGAGGAEVNLSNDAARAVFQHEILRAAPTGKCHGSDGKRQNERRDK